MATAVLPAPSEHARRHQLVAARRRAGAVLAGAGVVLAVVIGAGGDATWAGYVQAAAEASLVGGLADWFAVTALFRHPLGIRLPHTAIVRERKDQFGATLGRFVEESFLSPDSVVKRLAAARIGERAGAWLARPAEAERVAAYLADALAAAAELVSDEDAHRLADEMVRDRLERMELAPLAGRAVGFLTAGGRHDEVLDAAIAGVDRWLDEHRDELQERFGQRSPWWMPGAVEHRIFEQLLGGVRSLLQDMVGDPQHELRRRLDERIQQLVLDLETSADLRRRGEQLKDELLDHPQVREWTESLWGGLKSQLLAQAAHPSSALRHRLASAVGAAGRRLVDDPVLAAKVQQAAEVSARYVVEHFSGEIAGLVRGTIAGWDGEETSDRLELLLGPDLQYIRINGTVVGGAVGLALHGIGQAVG